MAVLETRMVEKNSGAAVEVKTGQRLRIAGKSIVDFVAFNLHDLPNDSIRPGQRRIKSRSLSAPVMCCIQSETTRC